MIRTVLGDIDDLAAGHVQCHEHILIQKGSSFDCNPALWMDDEDASAHELLDYTNAGGGLIVDAQPPFCGRMPEALMRLARQTGVYIVATTGFHKEQFYAGDAPFHDASDETLAQFFLSELTEAMHDDSGRRLAGRCGVLKGALEAGGIQKNGWTQRRFQALAQAARQSGAPLMFHIDPGADVNGLLAFVQAEGLPFDRVLLCHLDRTHPDHGLHTELLQAGVRLNYDSVCRLKYVTHEQEIALIAAMCRAGFVKQITLSLDTTRTRLAAYGGEIGLGYILSTFIPMLREGGVTDAEIQMMTTTNGQAALDFKTTD